MQSSSYRWFTACADSYRTWAPAAAAKQSSGDAIVGASSENSAAEINRALLPPSFGRYGHPPVKG